jgi:uncharacterized protein (TIGR03382 family)
MRWSLPCSVFLLVTLVASGLLGGSAASADAVERTVWEQRTDALPATAPTPRTGGAVAYDSVRNRLVLYGGYVSGDRLLDDTWEWDGHAWERKRPSTSPGPSAGHAMVFDSDRARVVLVGGLQYPAGDPPYKVWEWDGMDWTARTTNRGPRPLSDARGVGYELAGHAMAYDAARKTIVLVGEHGTWELSGDTWTMDAPFSCPGGRVGCPVPLGPGIERFNPMSPRQIALTYDSSMGRTLYFQGRHLWQWNGSEWTSLTPDAQTCHDTSTCDAYPESRFGALLIFDPARGRTVLHGGSFAGSSLHGPYEPGAGRFGDTWEWDGIRWTKLAESSPLGARSEVMGAYDTAQQKVLLFGGNGRSASNDLWSFQGVDWQREMAATSPPVRSALGGHALAYDPVREEVVLFGGRGWTLTLGDTWVWNGRSWSERKSETSPAPRVGHRMVFDRARGVMVMFGGELSDATNSYSVPTDPTWEWADTWEWNGQTWTRRQVANAPTPRSSHGMTYDERRHVSVMYGGGSNETWEWNGENWSKRTPLVTPGVRSGSAMTYDTQRQRAVMYGGSESGGDESDIWEWDGATWTELTPASAIPPRSDAALVFHRVRGVALLFGGGPTGDDTWEWNASELVERVLMPRPPRAVGQAMAYDERRVRAVLLPNGAGDDLWEYHAAGEACSADTECDEQMCIDGRCHSRGDALSVPDHPQDAGVEDAGTVDEVDASVDDDAGLSDDDSDEDMDDSEALDGGETPPDDPSDADAGASPADDSTRRGGGSGCSASSGPDGGTLLGSLMVLGLALQRRRRLRRSEPAARAS